MKTLDQVIRDLPEEHQARIKKRLKELLDDPEIKSAVHRRPTQQLTTGDKQ